MSLFDTKPKPLRHKLVGVIADECSFVDHPAQPRGKIIIRKARADELTRILLIKRLPAR